MSASRNGPAHENSPWKSTRMATNSCGGLVWRGCLEPSPVDLTATPSPPVVDSMAFQACCRQSKRWKSSMTRESRHAILWRQLFGIMKRAHGLVQRTWGRPFTWVQHPLKRCWRQPTKKASQWRKPFRVCVTPSLGPASANLEHP